MEKTRREIAGPVCTDQDRAVCHKRKTTIIDDCKTPQTRPAGRKRVGRKAGPAVLWGR